MLSESLDKLRRGTMMSAILLLGIGAVILICPEIYAGALILAFGYAMVIAAIVMLLELFTGKNVLKEFLKLIIALLVGIVGICVLLYRDDVMRTLAWLSSFLLLLDGLRTLSHSVTFVRRARRKSWWVLTLLAVAEIACAVILFFNPWWNTPVMLMKVIGIVALLAALISIIHLIMTRPGNKEGGKSNG